MFLWAISALGTVFSAQSLGPGALLCEHRFQCMRPLRPPVSPRTPGPPATAPPIARHLLFKAHLQVHHPVPGHVPLWWWPTHKQDAPRCIFDTANNCACLDAATSPIMRIYPRVWHPDARISAFKMNETLPSTGQMTWQWSVHAALWSAKITAEDQTRPNPPTNSRDVGLATDDAGGDYVARGLTSP